MEQNYNALTNKCECPNCDANISRTSVIKWCVLIITIPAFIYKLFCIKKCFTE